MKRLDEKNKQFSTDVSEKHDYIKDLISTTKSTLQTEISDSCATVKVRIINMFTIQSFQALRFRNRYYYAEKLKR